VKRAGLGFMLLDAAYVDGCLDGEAENKLPRPPGDSQGLPAHVG